MRASSDAVSEATRMGERAPRGMLYVIVCAAPPATQVQDLVKLAQAAGWEVAVTATPEALAFIDAPLLEAITGHPVRHRWREPDEPETVPEANAIVVAPATFNTINRWVAGITNTVAVGTLCESLGLDGPIVGDRPVGTVSGRVRGNRVEVADRRQGQPGPAVATSDGLLAARAGDGCGEPGLAGGLHNLVAGDAVGPGGTQGTGGTCGTLRPGLVPGQCRFPASADLPGFTVEDPQVTGVTGLVVVPTAVNYAFRIGNCRNRSGRLGRCRGGGRSRRLDWHRGRRRACLLILPVVAAACRQDQQHHGCGHRSVCHALPPSSARSASSRARPPSLGHRWDVLSAGCEPTLFTSRTNVDRKVGATLARTSDGAVTRLRPWTALTMEGP
jgi:Flavoprotein